MEEDKKDKEAPLLRVHTVGQRAASPERMVVVQTNRPSGAEASAQPPAKLTRVVSSSAAGGDKPAERISAEDVNRILGAKAVAALEQMRRGR